MFILIALIIFLLLASVPYVYYLIKIHNLTPDSPSVYIYPPVSVVINAYREGERLGERVKNIMETDYPKDKVKFYVVNDGAESDVEFEGVETINFKERQGKNNCINYMLKKCETEIVVFTDADVSNDKNMLCELIAPFADEKIGAVCGDVVVVGSKITDKNESAYRSVYSLMCEVDGDNVRNFNGQILACRKSAVPEISLKGADDANIAFTAHANGYKTKYVSGAKVYESQPVGMKSQFKQKTRRANALMLSYARDKSPLVMQTSMRCWMLMLSPTFLLCSLVLICFCVPPYGAILAGVFILACVLSSKTLIGAFAINNFYLLCGMFIKNSERWNAVQK